MEIMRYGVHYARKFAYFLVFGFKKKIDALRFYYYYYFFKVFIN